MKKNLYILTLPVLILIVGLACNLSGGPTPPREVPTSPELAQDVGKTVQAVQPDPTSGILQYTVTEAELTSYIVFNLKQDYEAILKNPVIVLQPDQLELYGTVVSDSINANGRIVMKVNVDDQGKPKVTITEANFGPFPVPAGLLDNLSKTIDRSLEDAMTKNNSDYRVESIKINTGSAVVTLRKK